MKSKKIILISLLILIFFIIFGLYFKRNETGSYGDERDFLPTLNDLSDDWKVLVDSSKGSAGNVDDDEITHIYLNTFGHKNLNFTVTNVISFSNKEGLTEIEFEKSKSNYSAENLFKDKSLNCYTIEKQDLVTSNCLIDKYITSVVIDSNDEERIEISENFTKIMNNKILKG